jgi:hypothetical protein
MGGWTGAGAVGALAVFAVCVCRDWPQQSIVGWLRQVSTDGCSDHVDILVVSPSGASPTVHRVTAAVRAAEAQLSGFPTYRLHVHTGTLTGPSDTKIQPSPLPAIKDIASVGPDAALPVPSEEGVPDQPGTCSGIAVVRALAQLYSTSTSVPDGVVSVPWPGWVRTSDHGIVLFLCDRMSPTEGLAAVVATELDPEEAPPPDRFDTAVVLVDGADPTTTATLGDTTCADVYQDGSHLNTEQTLRCLLDQPRERNSAQAAFLRRGLDVRVHDMEGSLSGERLDRILLHTILDTRHDHCIDRPVSDTEAALTPWLTCPTPTMEAVPRLMSDTNSSVADAVAGGKPTLLVGTVVDDWSFFAKHSSVSTVVGAVAATDENVNGNGGVFVDVKLSPRGNFMDPSTDAKLADALPPIDLGYTTANMTAPELIKALNIQQAPHVLGRAWGDMGHTVSQHFVALPRAMHDLFEPSQPLFWTDEDHRLRKQFLWMSSPGGRTHLHFDQDHNVFVQLVGTKRFTLYPAADHHRLLPFPRLHPLWHKAQVEFPVPGVVDDGRLRCAAGRRQQVTVGPGDVLYIPPYVWHEVETLTPSVSMASLSHDDAIRSAMEMIYRHGESAASLGAGRQHRGCYPFVLCIVVLQCSSSLTMLVCLMPPPRRLQVRPAGGSIRKGGGVAVAARSGGWHAVLAAARCGHPLCPRAAP